MSASEKTQNSQSRNGGSRAGSNGSGSTRGTAARAAKGTEDTITGTLTALPAPVAEKTQAAVHAVRGSVGPGGWVWTALRDRKALSGGAAAGTAAALTAAYALGRRAGLRRRGPLSRLTGGRI
ncbi:hypothetical protein [Streptomyces tritici]|uniref:hypothetical protein n=1 Tax=Streptomyces tritici TaxID=2054410 RepID=UPI003AF11DDF